MPPDTLWIAAAVALVLLLVLVPALILRRRREARRRLPEDWAVQQRAVFNVDERRLYRQICAALPGCVVLAKLPLVRLCQPLRPREVRYWYDLLGAIHVSFVVCTPMGRVLAVVDIDGDRGQSRRTLQIKEKVLAACEVRYLRCAPQQMPSVPELRALVPLPAPVAENSPVAETRDRLSSTVKSRRMARGNAWQDSVAAPADSGFITSSLGGGNSGFGGVVVDNHNDPPVRH